METESAVMDLTVACVTSVKNATGFELDLTQDTLPLLDHYGGLAESPATRSCPYWHRCAAPISES